MKTEAGRRPFGNRIVALGHEDVTGPDGSRDISLAVSLIDVTHEPKLLSRVAVGGGWGWVPGSRDDFAKVFKVLPEEDLVVFPFQAWSQKDWRYVGGAQLIDWKGDELIERGLVKDAGWVERAIPYQGSTLLTISQESFQVMDIADRDAPKLRGKLELSRNVQQFAVIDDEHAVQLTGDWWMGDTKLVVTPLSDPDTASPVASLSAPAPNGRMWTNGSFAYLAGVRNNAMSMNGQATRIDVSISDARVSQDARQRHPPGVRAAWLPDRLLGLGRRIGPGGRLDARLPSLQLQLLVRGLRRLRPVQNRIPSRAARRPVESRRARDGGDPHHPQRQWTWGLRAIGNMLVPVRYHLFKRDGRTARPLLPATSATPRDGPRHPVLHDPSTSPATLSGRRPTASTSTPRKAGGTRLPAARSRAFTRSNSPTTWPPARLGRHGRRHRKPPPGRHYVVGVFPVGRNDGQLERPASVDQPLPASVDIACLSRLSAHRRPHRAAGRLGLAREGRKRTAPSSPAARAFHLQRAGHRASGV